MTRPPIDKILFDSDPWVWRSRWGNATVKYAPDAQGLGRFHGLTPAATKLVEFAVWWSDLVLSVRVWLEGLELRCRGVARVHQARMVAWRKEHDLGER
jgi:hypothetical protein